MTKLCTAYNNYPFLDSDPYVWRSQISEDNHIVFFGETQKALSEEWNSWAKDACRSSIRTCQLVLLDEMEQAPTHMTSYSGIEGHRLVKNLVYLQSVLALHNEHETIKTSLPFPLPQLALSLRRLQRPYLEQYAEDKILKPTREAIIKCPTLVRRFVNKQLDAKPLFAVS